AEKDGGSPPERFPDETRPAAIGNELKSNGAVERDADAAVDATVAAMPAQRDAGDVPTAIDAESPGRLVREDESDENNIWRTPDEPVEQAPVGQGPHETASREGEVESTDGDEG